MSVGRTGRQVALVFVLVVGLLWTGVATDPAAATTGLRGQMLELTNDARVKKDRSLLHLDLELSRYAKKHARAMADAGELFHTTDLSAKLRGRAWTTAGENIGVASSLRKLQDSFMASKLHRRNILNPDFEDVGIGVVEVRGDYWVTLIFYG